MEEQQTRDFKGIFIPKDIWFDTRLNMLEKGILMEIDSLDGINGCYASNQHLAEFCGCSETKVSTAISKLIELGYIYLESFNGRQRVLKSSLSNFERQDLKKLNAEFKNFKDSNIIENNNKENNNIIILKDQKHKYGEYQNVLLTDKQLQKLYEDYGEEQTKKAITYLDEYIQMKGYKCKEHNLALRKWVFDAIVEKDQKKLINNMTVKETGLSFSEILRRL